MAGQKICLVCMRLGLIPIMLTLKTQVPGVQRLPAVPISPSKLDDTMVVQGGSAGNAALQVAAVTGALVGSSAVDRAGCVLRGVLPDMRLLLSDPDHPLQVPAHLSKAMRAAECSDPLAMSLCIGRQHLVAAGSASRCSHPLIATKDAGELHSSATPHSN